jgi:hypothetical protein
VGWSCVLSFSVDHSRYDIQFRQDWKTRVLVTCLMQMEMCDDRLLILYKQVLMAPALSTQVGPEYHFPSNS